MKQPPPIARLRLRYRSRFDAVMMLFYLVIVYAWSAGTQPLGRDYAALTVELGRSLPFLARGLFAWEIQTFGEWPLGYHLVNLALLYVSMVAIYWFTNYAIKGLWWLGTLSACLFMANPVHTEAILNLCGVGDLLPFLFAILALALYASHAWEPEPWRLAGALAVFALAVLPYAQNAYLFLVLVLYDLLITEPENRNPKRWIPFLIITLAAFAWNGGAIIAPGFSPARMWSPLYLIFYPIGLLPETARLLHEWPLLGYAAALAVIAILILIYRKARRPAILFGLLAMAAIRLYAGDRPVDPVHMIGGGQLLLANVLFNCALVGLFLRIMENIKWRLPAISLTTMLCIAAFLMQIRENSIWRNAGREVQAFRESAASLARQNPGSTIGICPDYQFFNGAPLCFSESVRYMTPFGPALQVRPLLAINRDKENTMAVTIEQWSDGHGRVRITGTTPLAIAPWPYRLLMIKGWQETDGVRATLVDVSPEAFSISLVPTDGHPLPPVTLPVPATAPLLEQPPS